jgi:hypothetical protein
MGYRYVFILHRPVCLAMLCSRNCLLLQNVHSGSGAHPPLYSTITGVSIQTGTWMGHQADHSPPPILEFKNE